MTPAVATTIGSQALDALRAVVRGAVVAPSDDEYEAARMVWNAMIDKRPALIVRCSGTADVVATLAFARDHDLPVAVRGGGHNSGGSGVCDEGVLIDLGAMNAVRIDPAQRRAWVQGGATWGEFDREAQLFGLAAPGGVVSTTGVGGLSLAGGLGWLRGRFDLSIDNVVSVDIVTADGVCRRASATQHPDLYWGVRGGGNFGVVTSFEFQLHPVGPTVMFLAPVYRARDAAHVIRCWRDFMLDAPDEIAGSYVEFSTLPEDPDLPMEAWGECVATLAGVWAGPAHVGEAAVKPLREFAQPLVDLSARMSYCDVQSLFDRCFPAASCAPTSSACT